MTPHATTLAALVTKFQARYPEFSAAGLTQISATLDDARAQVDPDVFGAADDIACMLLGAHLLATGPDGNPVRIKLSDGTFTTTYKIEFDRMVLQYANNRRPIVGPVCT